jgi:hypothetical protein
MPHNAGKDELPPKARGLANAIISGCWHYDTYLGRKWEIEHALFETTCKALDEGQDYIKCRQHKTSKTYGDIVKYLSPGLVQALQLYRSLPRPEGCKYLLVPVHACAETVCIPTSLRIFNRKFLGAVKVSPTTNQIRIMIGLHTPTHNNGRFVRNQNEGPLLGVCFYLSTYRFHMYCDQQKHTPNIGPPFWLQRNRPLLWGGGV